MRYKTILAQMSLEDKVALCSGANHWETKAFPQYGIPSIFMSDGPHGLRKQDGGVDHPGVGRSTPATCFPPACATACSWDRALLKEMGAALGDEARQEGVAVVLGPGVNIKRNPLCGRNFEYFSEDPYLAGEMAAGWINGVQSRDVGASLKHFAANSQENQRMTSDSIVDERTLREIYLPAFEKAVKDARPATVMCAYNKLNGVYCSDNAYLLRDILRTEWGFSGVVVSDWGAMSNRVKAIQAGLDLEMPGGVGFFDAGVIAAVKSGALEQEKLDECVDRLLELIFTGDNYRQANSHYDVEQHHKLAQKIAVNSAVLLKNDGGLLPLDKRQKIALIGALAESPRYQGAGSSFIHPTRLPNAIEGFKEQGFDFTYYPGYPLKGEASESLLPEALAGAKQCDLVVIFAGLPEEYEAEGFDRADMSMPACQNELIARVAETNPNTVVVLTCGAPVEMPWLPKVKALLHMHLPGQAVGPAAAELLIGAANPSGKLAESYPLRYADVPSAGFYAAGGKQAQYREGIYVGYRYYDKAKKEVLFPFGHGLSYTTFEYSDLRLSASEMQDADALEVSMTIRNTGALDGAEVVQLYVCPPAGPVFRPEKELKQFDKVFLKAGEEKPLSFRLDSRAFAYYDAAAKAWRVPAGEYGLAIGASSRDIRLQGNVNIHGAPASAPNVAAWYAQPKGEVSQADFESLLGRRIEPLKKPRRGEYTLANTLLEMSNSLAAKVIIRYVKGRIAKDYADTGPDSPNYRMMVESALNSPLQSLVATSGGEMSAGLVWAIVHFANGRILQGLRVLSKKPAPPK